MTEDTLMAEGNVSASRIDALLNLSVDDAYSESRSFYGMNRFDKDFIDQEVKRIRNAVNPAIGRAQRRSNKVFRQTSGWLALPDTGMMVYMVVVCVGQTDIEDDDDDDL